MNNHSVQSTKAKTNNVQRVTLNGFSFPVLRYTLDVERWAFNDYASTDGFENESAWLLHRDEGARTMKMKKNR